MLFGLLWLPLAVTCACGEGTQTDAQGEKRDGEPFERSEVPVHDQHRSLD